MKVHENFFFNNQEDCILRCKILKEKLYYKMLSLLHFFNCLMEVFCQEYTSKTKYLYNDYSKIHGCYQNFTWWNNLIFYN